MNLKTSTPFQKLKDALELFKKGGRYNIDLSDYLKRFLKNSVKENLIKKILRLVRMAHSRYDIYVYFASGGIGAGIGMPYNEIFFDAVCSFVLTRSNKALCSIGFDFIDRDNDILVSQIQGVRGRQEKLSPFRWEKMLLQILIDWAKQKGFKRIDVIRSTASKWYNKGNAQNLYLKYDVTARRMGFVYDKKREVYSLSL